MCACAAERNKERNSNFLITNPVLVDLYLDEAVGVDLPFFFEAETFSDLHLYVAHIRIGLYENVHEFPIEKKDSANDIRLFVNGHDFLL